MQPASTRRKRRPPARTHTIRVAEPGARSCAVTVPPAAAPMLFATLLLH